MMVGVSAGQRTQGWGTNGPTTTKSENSNNPWDASSWSLAPNLRISARNGIRPCSGDSHSGVALFLFDGRCSSVFCLGTGGEVGATKHHLPIKRGYPCKNSGSCALTKVKSPTFVSPFRFERKEPSVMTLSGSSAFASFVLPYYSTCKFVNAQTRSCSTPSPI